MVVFQLERTLVALHEYLLVGGVVEDFETIFQSKTFLNGKWLANFHF